MRDHEGTWAGLVSVCAARRIVGLYRWLSRLKASRDSDVASRRHGPREGATTDHRPGSVPEVPIGHYRDGLGAPAV